MEQFAIVDPRKEPKLCQYMVSHDTVCNRPHRNPVYHLCYLHLNECKIIAKAKQAQEQKSPNSDCVPPNPTVIEPNQTTLNFCKQIINNVKTALRQDPTQPINVIPEPAPINPILLKTWPCKNPPVYEGLTYLDLLTNHWGFVTWVARKTIADNKRENKFRSPYDDAFVELTDLATNWDRNTNTLGAKTI